MSDDFKINLPPNSSPSALGRYKLLHPNNFNNKTVPVKQSVSQSESSAQVALRVGQRVVGHGAGGLKPDEFKVFRVTARFSAAEREILVRHAEKSCLTVSEYIRASVLGAGYLSVIDPMKRELLKNVSRELGRQGNNLNQIAKHMNGGTSSSEEGNSMLAIITRSLLSTHQSVRQALAEGRSAP